MQRSHRMNYAKLYCTTLYKGLVHHTMTILNSTQVDITVVCYTTLRILLYITLHYLTSPGVSAIEIQKHNKMSDVCTEQYFERPRHDSVCRLAPGFALVC